MVDATAQLCPGTVVADRYRLDYKIGSGGMGQVWAGEQLAIGRRVALKLLLPAGAARHDIVTRFKREAMFLGRIESDHVARVLDFVSDPACGLALVMEFVEGESLSDLVHARRASVEEALEIGTDLAAGLVDLHRARVIHRDLKPANVILRPLSSGRRRATIVDFGVSLLVGQEEGSEDLTRLTKAHVTLGTLEYMAPEQVLNARDAVEVSDVYAIGAILFRAVSGHHVFGAGRGGPLMQEKLVSEARALSTGRTDPLARGLERVVAKALRRRPAERYASAAELLGELLPLRDMVRTRAAPPSSVPPPQPAGAPPAELTTAEQTQLGRVVIAKNVLVASTDLLPSAAPARPGPAPGTQTAASTVSSVPPARRPSDEPTVVGRAFSSQPPPILSPVPPASAPASAASQTPRRVMAAGGVVAALVVSAVLVSRARQDAAANTTDANEAHLTTTAPEASVGMPPSSATAPAAATTATPSTLAPPPTTPEIAATPTPTQPVAAPPPAAVTAVAAAKPAVAQASTAAATPKPVAAAATAAPVAPAAAAAAATVEPARPVAVATPAKPPAQPKPPAAKPPPDDDPYD